MKLFLLNLLFLTGISANAAVYKASEYTCSELNSFLAQDGQIEIKRLIGSSTYFSSGLDCYGGEEAKEHFEFSKDSWSCQLGYECVKIPGAR